MTTTAKSPVIALLNGKTAQPLKSGKVNAFNAKWGEHYRIVKVTEGAEQLLDNVIAKRVGNDLSLNYAEGTQVILRNYYIECKAQFACDVTLPGQAGLSYQLTGDGAPGAALSEGVSMVYAHGGKDALMGMTLGNDVLHSALTGYYGTEITYVPVAQNGGGSLLLLGVLALGALGAAAGGGGGGGSGSAAVSAPPSAHNMVNGTLVGGPVIVSNDLYLVLYKADGITQVGARTHFSGTGTFSIDVGSYTGVVIAKVTDGGTGMDYIDEATGKAVDLTANLMAVGLAQAGTVNININPLTTIVALKMGAVYAGASATLITEALIAQTNTAVASVFGLNGIHAAGVVTTVNLSGTANAAYTPGDMSAEEAYGAILAAMSGVDKANGGNTQTTIDQLVRELTLTGTTGSLSPTGYAAVIVGANVSAFNANGAATTGLTSVVSSLMVQKNTSVGIDSVSAGDVISDIGQAIMLSGTVAVGATVGLLIGGIARSAVVKGDTWTYTLSGADINAIGQGGKALTATATLSDGSTRSVMRNFVVLADAESTNQSTSAAALLIYKAAKALVVADVNAASADPSTAASALAAVNTTATATVAIAAAQKWVTDATTQSTDTAAQSLAAAVLKAAAVATASVGDDAVATTAVSESATASTAAASNLLSANAALVLAQNAQTNLTASEPTKDANAEAALLIYKAAAAVVVADLTTFNADQFLSIYTSGQVNGVTSANASFVAAQRLLTDANNTVRDCVIEKNSSSALLLAVRSTSATSDDASAALAVSQSNIDTATAARNLLIAQKAVSSAQILMDIYNGNLYQYAAPASAVGVSIAGSTNGLKNTLLLNNTNAAGAIAIADNLFASKSNIQNLVVGNTGAGAIALVMGALYSVSGINNIYLNDVSGAVAIDDSASVINSAMTVSSQSGAVSVTTGNSADSMNINTVSGAISILGLNGNNNIHAFSQSGAVSVNSGSGNNVINAASTQAAGAVHITLTTGNNNIHASTMGGAVVVLVADGANSIDATTYSGAITVNTGNGNNTISASTGTGIINVTTGNGNDDIIVGSGLNGAFINAGGGNNSITLLAHSGLADTIDASGANTTLVTGAVIGASFADVFKMGSISVSALLSTSQNFVGGTTAVAVSAAGVMSFTGSVTDTGATFAAHVLDILKANSSQFGKVVSYDDGFNQWLFVATSATSGHYLELIGSHDPNFAGASTTAAAHTILLG